MLHATTQRLRTMLVFPVVTDREDVMLSLATDPRFRIDASFADLASVRAALARGGADLILCHSSFRKHSDFAELRAEAEAQGGRVLAVPSGARIPVIAQAMGLPLLGSARGARRHTGSPPEARYRLVVIGASTGGIDALQHVLSSYPANCPPTAIVQHIKPEFLSGVVRRLGRHCAAEVVEATPNTILRPGQVALAPGLPKHLEIEPASLRCRLRDGPTHSGHRPSVDRLFQSVTSLGADVVGVLLTGMGRDGATGLGAMRRAGAWTIGQDARTSTVFGMPRVAHEEGAIRELLPLHRISRAILNAAEIPGKASR